ncbi:endonuclease-reverse transcriptase domain-containing protein [Phthorimaea operculella]|nr:endonuclease-reverse transcriptase domain-containing protein [Phthorimaea operculella]
MVKIPGYDLFRDDRLSKRSGGVAIYAINSSNFVTCKLNTSYNKKKEAWECLWLDVKIGNTKFLLCGVYRGHDSTVDQDNILLEELKLASETQTVVIMGDFNYNGVKWPLLNCGYHTPREDNFVQWFNSSNFEQLVDKHTRYRGGNQPSTLDLILTNDDALIAHVNHQAPIGKSDHTCLLSTMEIEAVNHNTTPITKWNYQKADFDKICKMLLDALPGEIDLLDCVEKQYEIFLRELNRATLLHVPRIKIDNTKITNKPWVSKDIKTLSEQKLHLWNRYMITGLDETYKEYRRLNNRLTNWSKSSRTKFEQNLINAGPKKFYSYISQQLASKISVPGVLRNKEVIFTREVVDTKLRVNVEKV